MTKYSSFESDTYNTNAAVQRQAKNAASRHLVCCGSVVVA